MIRAFSLYSRVALQTANNLISLQNRNRHYSTGENWTNIKYDEIPLNRIRNFSIIAHVDHGKSTLADRLLEMTGAISKIPGQNQVLDSLQVEKERGITVKAQSASLLYKHDDNNDYLLNLIDTPGHVDFSNEVTRSLGACEGVILLVDANQGVQAQTVANYHLAISKGLAVVPVLNKIDLKNADPVQVTIEMSQLFDIDPLSVLRISAKLGIGIEDLFKAIIERVPPPNAIRGGDFRALLFDSLYDRFRGVLNLICVRNGEVRTGQTIRFVHTDKTYTIESLSILQPAETQVRILKAGQVGLVNCRMKNINESLIGDTVCLKGSTVEPLPGFKPNQPMVFSGIYPLDQTKHVQLQAGIEKLILNDSAVTITPETSPALGRGWRLGFLGLLHMDVFCQRLEQEYNIESIVTAPSVTYKIVLGNAKLIKERQNNDTMYISNPLDLPDRCYVDKYYEPYVLGTIISPSEYVKDITSLCIERRSVHAATIELDANRVMMTYSMPLAEVVIDFHDVLKSITSGYASFDYEDKGYVETNIVKLHVMLNGKPVEEFSRLVHHSKAIETARQLVLNLKEMIPRQMVQIAIQASAGGKILARETIKAFRKDVTAKLYGGDVTRRMKLLKQQAEGKKRMRSIANIKVPQETYINLLRRPK